MCASVRTLELKPVSLLCAVESRHTLHNGVILYVVCHCTYFFMQPASDTYGDEGLNVILLSSVMARPATHEASHFITEVIMQPSCLFMMVMLNLVQSFAVCLLSQAVQNKEV